LNEGRLQDLEKIESKFRFVHVAARRARQLMSGARPLLETESRKPTRVAEEETLAGVVEYEIAPPQAAPEPEPEE
jgi:DNA-directed RNA polymerase subunit omega